MKSNFFIILVIFLNACIFKPVKDPFRIAESIVKINIDIEGYENLKCKIKVLKNTSEDFKILYNPEFKYNLSKPFIIYDTLHAVGLNAVSGQEFDSLKYKIDVPILITVQKGNKEIYKNKFKVKFIAGIFRKNEIPMNYIRLKK